MVGNDVVDLSDPETRAETLHPRFDARVLARSERARLAASGAPDRLRWMLWAAKEAAFKLLRKIDARTIFSPSRFVVRLDASLSGHVRCGGRVVRVQLRAQPTSIHAVASDSDTPETSILTATAELESASWTASPSPREAARTLALEGIAQRLGVARSDLAIERRGRVPTLLYRGGDTPIDLSLSHHGRLVAFACDVTHPIQAGGPLA